MSTAHEPAYAEDAQAEAALPALPGGEGEGRHRAVDVRRVDQRRARFAADLRPAVRRRRRHHPVLPAAGRPDARPRRGDDDPADPPRPADGLGRRRLAADDLVVVGPRAGPSLVPEGDGAGRHPAGRLVVRGGGAAVQGGRPRWARARGVRTPDRPVLVAARQPALGSLRRLAGEPDALLDRGARGDPGQGRAGLHRRHPDDRRRGRRRAG